MNIGGLAVMACAQLALADGVIQTRPHDLLEDASHLKHPGGEEIDEAGRAKEPRADQDPSEGLRCPARRPGPRSCLSGRR